MVHRDHRLSAAEDAAVIACHFGAPLPEDEKPQPATATRYFPEPAVSPITIYVRGRCRVNERRDRRGRSAAIVHQLMPCDPVWLATITGSVLRVKTGEQRGEEISFQQSTSERMKAATMPGSAIGTTMRRNAPQIEQPSTSAACSISMRDRVELVAHDPDDDRQHHQRIERG